MRPLLPLRRAFAGLMALVLLLAALGAPAHVHAAPGAGHETVAAAGGSQGTSPQDAGDLVCHGLRCACPGHGSARTDEEVRVAPPALLPAAHSPIPHMPALASRQDAPPLQPPRA